MIYITGDKHRDFSTIKTFCQENNTTYEDIMIVLGDAGINYCMNEHDREVKRYLRTIPITFFFIHGNHEQRPQELVSYHKCIWHGGEVYIEEEFPNLIFAADASCFDFDDKKYVTIGGAYSVDKYYRLMTGKAWWANEQPDDEIKQQFERLCESLDWKVNGVLSHTVPLKYEPTEMFLPGVDQSSVDKSTEIWLDSIEERLEYDEWYAGHYHTDKVVDKLTLMFNDIREL